MKSSRLHELVEETYPGHERKEKKRKKERWAYAKRRTRKTFFIVQTRVLYVSTSRTSKSRVSTLLIVRSVEILRGFPDFLDRPDPFHSSLLGGAKGWNQHASIFGPTSIKSGTVHRVHFRGWVATAIVFHALETLTNESFGNRRERESLLFKTWFIPRDYVWGIRWLRLWRRLMLCS